MEGDVLKKFLKELDAAYPDIVAVRNVFLKYQREHPEKLEALKQAFEKWLNKRYKGS